MRYSSESTLDFEIMFIAHHEKSRFDFKSLKVSRAHATESADVDTLAQRNIDTYQKQRFDFKSLKQCGTDKNHSRKKTSIHIKITH